MFKYYQNVLDAMNIVLFTIKHWCIIQIQLDKILNDFETFNPVFTVHSLNKHYSIKTKTFQSDNVPIFRQTLTLYLSVLKHEFHGVQSFFQRLPEGLRVGYTRGGERGDAEDDTFLLGVVAAAVSIRDHGAVAHEGAFCCRCHLVSWLLWKKIIK